MTRCQSGCLDLNCFDMAHPGKIRDGGASWLTWVLATAGHCVLTVIQSLIKVMAERLMVEQSIVCPFL